MTGKPILIAHRGLLYGPNKELENSPDQILEALGKGFDVEVDVFIMDDESIFLGHDEPTYPIKLNFLVNNHIWVHTKNFKALDVLSRLPGIHIFSHDTDKYVLTSRGFIWTYPDESNEYSSRSVAVMPENIYEVYDIYDKFKHCYGICSDYVGVLL